VLRERERLSQPDPRAISRPDQVGGSVGVVMGAMLDVA
jgi:hypothetical protein